MNPDREAAYELVASQPEISLDAATVREIVEKYNCDDSPHFLATVHLAERVIQLERDNAAKAEPSPTEGTPLDVLDWLKEAAHLLDLYHSGYCPKNVAATLLDKIRTNWPDLLTPIPERAYLTREQEKDAEIERQAGYIHNANHALNLGILESQEFATKYAALQVSHDRLLEALKDAPQTEHDPYEDAGCPGCQRKNAIAAAEKLTGRKG